MLERTIGSENGYYTYNDCLEKNVCMHIVSAWVQIQYKRIQIDGWSLFKNRILRQNWRIINITLIYLINIFINY